MALGFFTVGPFAVRTFFSYGELSHGEVSYGEKSAHASFYNGHKSQGQSSSPSKKLNQFNIVDESIVNCFLIGVATHMLL